MYGLLISPRITLIITNIQSLRYSIIQQPQLAHNQYFTPHHHQVIHYQQDADV